MSGVMYASVSWEQSAMLVLIVALFLAAAALVVLSTSEPQQWRWRRRSRSRYPYRLHTFDGRQKPDLADVGQQLHAVMASSFEKQRVLSSAEYRVFAIVEHEIAAQRAGYRVFAQTSLGE